MLNLDIGEKDSGSSFSSKEKITYTEKIRAVPQFIILNPVQLISVLNEQVSFGICGRERFFGVRFVTMQVFFLLSTIVEQGAMPLPVLWKNRILIHEIEQIGRERQTRLPTN